MILYGFIDLTYMKKMNKSNSKIILNHPFTLYQIVKIKFYLQLKQKQKFVYCCKQQRSTEQKQIVDFVHYYQYFFIALCVTPK